MLSPGAFNALLKTLEEPPAHVKFILATTEPQKLPATILSRCQRFDFKKISNENIVKRLEYIVKESNIEITEDALKLIAILSEGAMRDALSILERCLQDGDGKIDEDKIKDLAGIPKLTYIHAIVKAFLGYNVEDAIKAVDVVLNEGKDLNNLLWEIIKYVKDILVFKATGKLERYSESEITEIKQLADIVDKQRLLYIITDLSKLENDMKWSSQKSILFQVEIIKLCSDLIIPSEQGKLSNTSGKQRDKNQTQANEIPGSSDDGSYSASKNANNSGNNGAYNAINNGNNSVKAEKANFAQAISNFGEAKGWQNVLTNLKQNGKFLIYSNLLKAKAIELNDMIIGISFPDGINAFGKSILEKPENITELTRAISMEYGKDMKIKLIENLDSLPKKEEKNNNSISNMTNELGIPINVVE